MDRMMKRLGRAGLGLAAALFVVTPVAADTLANGAGDWPAVEAQARGQTVYFHAWGGAETINAYLDWAAGELKARHDVTLVQVKLDDTAKAVSTVLAEKAAGRTDGGSVDLIWLNGENFAAMKDAGLLYGPDWATKLPNWAYVDPGETPTVLRDFTVPTEGLESPWGGGKLTFFYDSARTPAADLPGSAEELLAFAKAHPGRVSYPLPPDFTGSSFLKQVLIEKAVDPARLAQPVDPARFEVDAAPLFAYLDRLHPHLWREGRAFPQNYADMKQKLADGELDIAFAFNPAEASTAIRNGELPDTVRSFTFPGGTLANTHFLAIPFNANAKAGALVAANFLLSPEAQARKQDPAIWGDPTVLSMARLSAADRARFAALDLGVATLPPDQLGPALDEPHPSWMTAIEAAWQARYGSR